MAHPPTRLALQSSGVPVAAVKVLLRALQVMQFCLRTGFGEASGTYGGTERNGLAGSGQENGAAPPSFVALSTLVVNTYKRSGRGAKITPTRTARLVLLAAIMYVNDTGLLH